MKNVSLIQIKTNQIKSWRLLNGDGEVIEYFNTFNLILLKKYAKNTRTIYCKGVALFIDYLEEVNIVFSDKGLSQSFLVDAIESFPEWLLYGPQSGNDIAKKISETYASPDYSRQSVDLIMTSIRLFLSISERIRLTQEALEENVNEPLFVNINTSKPIFAQQKNLVIKKSLLGGVIANGPQLMKICILPIRKSQNYFLKERAFPFGKVIEFIDSMTSYRDKSLYMLCAASGCRVHEALQLLIEDISIKERSVRLINPFSRITDKSYQILNADEKTQLSWKGRQTDRTVLIQPFADLFFEYLEKYIKEEYVQHNKHNFVFQHIRGSKKGKPYFLSAPSTRFEAFQKGLEKVDISDSLSQGVHSLRHMYATYLINYFPKSDGTFGLSASIVQKIMGHSTLDATQKYARHDQDLIAVELEYANNLVYHKNEEMSLLQLKRKALKSQLLEVERKCYDLQHNG